MRIAAACLASLLAITHALAQPAESENNREPRVRLIEPKRDAELSAPANIVLQAQARDRDHNLARVEFHANGALVGASTTEPYSLNWGPLWAGEYVLIARAIDALGATDESRPVTIRVAGNHAPAVALTTPANGSVFIAPLTIAVTANATDADGDLSRVDFYSGDTLIGTAATPPYTINWNTAPGAHSLTAQAIDSQGVIAKSAVIFVTVNAAIAKLYFVHVDHLNTPRLIADDQQRTVWRWDQQEPFGVNVPDENPSGLGLFEFPLRLPGQYFDNETNLHYNYHRDYDPTIGSYKQSDPIGLHGGINTYSYALSNPVGAFDVDGLQVRLMCRLLGGYFATVSQQIYGQPQKHCFVYVSCPEENWAYTLSLFANAPFFRTGVKSKAAPLAPNSDDPNSPNLTNNILIQPTTPNCPPCAFEKDVLYRFGALPTTLPYNLFSMNSNSFASTLVTSQQFGTSMPTNAINNAPALGVPYRP
ncbi:MAG TPA: Ig-like domain-containing protein [Burkholderiales bacterium]|nr:Ig-like domain-containing protein [Burkholderiales bacterium]